MLLSDQFGLGPEFIDETTVVSLDLSSEVVDDSQAAHGTPPADKAKKAATKNQTKPTKEKIFRASKQKHHI